MKSKSYNGQVIPINRDNVDTDLIIPKQYLKSIKKSGFGPFLFDSLVIFLLILNLKRLNQNSRIFLINIYQLLKRRNMEVEKFFET